MQNEPNSIATFVYTTVLLVTIMKNADSKQQEVLYLEICSHEKEGTLPLHTSIALFLLSYCECKSFKLFLVTSTPITSQSWKTQVPSFLGASEVGVEDLPWLVGGCRLPAVLDVTGMYCRAGLAVVLRHIINRTVDAEPSRKDVLALLGFKKTCLKACAEVSQWTRLCELGIPSAVEEHLQKSTDHSLQLPSAIVNLEKRLGEPVKVHNDDKIRRQKLKQQQRQQQMKRKEGETSDVPEDVNDKNQLDQLTPSDDLEFKAALAILSLDAVTPTATRECSEIRKVKTTELPPLEHVFAEGLYFTLTDVVLLPCIHRYLAETNIKPLCQSWHMFPLSKVVLGHLVKGDYTAKAFENKETSSLQAHCPGALSQLPLLLRWYGRVQEVPGVLRAAHACGMPFSTLRPAPPAPAEAPLTDRAERESPGKPTEVPFIGGPRPTMTKLKESGIEAVFSPHPCPAWSLPWDSLPAAVNPTEGKMSDGRAVRKRQQLNNLVTMVTELAKPGDTVVDFCSGGGHVGIVIAHTLPNSKVILIENKEESLVRAKERCTELGLANIGFIQANLDYFTGPFHIGVALHACGVATDMVVEHCVEAGAAFVVSPCCYGFIQNTVKFTFPRSKRFQETLNFKEHMVLCRFADQTAGQLPPERRLVGKQCMGLVDLDRSWAAEPHGYSVRVMTMEPESCSPKNNMLVGVFRGHTNAMPIRSIGPDPLAADSNIG